MKQIKYFCDVCHKEIKNIKEDDCIVVDLFKGHDWTTDLPKALVMKDIQVCGDCGKKINAYIDSLIEEGKS